MLTKGAIGNLVNRYKAVLRNCNLINTFGSLAVASMLVLGGAGVAGAAEWNGGTYSLTVKSTSSLHGGVFSTAGTYHAEGTLLTDDTNTFNNVTFKNNKSENTGGECYGGVIYNAKTLNLNDCTFEGNTLNSVSGKAHGGAIANAGTMTVTGCTFDGNTTSNNGVTSSDQYGSAIFNSGTITITGSTFKGHAGGRAVYNSAGSAVLSGNTFEDNARGCVQTEAAASVIFEGENEFLNNGSNSIKNKGTTTFADGSSTTFEGNKVDIDNAGTVNIEKGGTVDMGSGMIGDGTVNLAGKLSGVITTEEEGETANTVVFDGGEWTVTGASTVNTMSGDGTIVIDSEDAKITAQSEVDGDNLTAKGSGALNDQTGGDLSAVKEAVDGLGIAVTGMEEGFVAGAVDKNGKMAKNSIMDAALKQASVTTVALDKILTNDVRKRLGDIRSDKNTTGVWMRWDGGKLQGNGLSNEFNTIQIGGDTKVGKNCRLGVAGTFTHGDAEFARGDAELEGFTFATYATWMGENGMFADVVARLGQFSNEMKVEGRTGDMNNRVFSLSGEYGWRLPVCDQFFVEPQVELAYTYVSSDELELGNAQYQFDNVNSLTGRAGVVFGWNLPDDRGNVYARASVLQQFMGDAKITGAVTGGKALTQEIDGDDTWLEYGIGANVKLTEKTYIWADVERTEGADLDEEWRGTVGIRYSF